MFKVKNVKKNRLPTNASKNFLLNFSKREEKKEEENDTYEDIKS